MNKQYKNLIDSHDVISFDIFDTLLLRPYINPYHLMKHVEKCTGQVGFYSARMKAEHIARQKSKAEDITFDDIYNNIPCEFRRLRDTELEFEALLLKPNSEVLEIYKYAIQTNKKIAFISDMYLPREFLIRVLNKNGYDKFDWFYLSSEKGVSKYTGNLFRVFLSDNGLKASDVLHIGDSAISDVKMARGIGIHTLHIPKLTDRFFYKNPRFKRIYSARPDSLEISIVLAYLAYSWNKNKRLLSDSDNYWKDFGFAIGGPIAYGFCSYILDTAQKNDKKQVLFIARDGYTLKRSFDILKSRKCDISTYYVYAQRAIRAKCLLDWGDEHNADLVLMYLNNSGIKVPKLTGYVQKNQFLLDNINLLRSVADKHCEEYKKYLASLGINKTKSMLIADSGAATFSAQRLLSKILNTRIDGVYSIITGPKFAKDNNITYYVWSEKTEHIKNITSIIEFVFMAPEPPVVDICDNAPVYQAHPHPSELFRNKLAPFISDGIVSFVEGLHKRLMGLDFVWDASCTNDFVMGYLSQLSYLDVTRLGSINSSSNAAHTEYKQNLLKDVYSYDLVKYGRLFGLPIKRCRSLTGYTIYLCGVAFIKKIDKGNKQYFRLFGFVPLLKIKNAANKRKYYLFDIFKVFITF